MARDFYEILGVSRDAGPADIKQAYRELVKKHHPDRNQNNPRSEETFKQIRDAYEVLGNPEKRRVYDRFGEAGLSGGGQTHPGFGSFEDMFEGFGGIFEEMFSRGQQRGGRGRARRGDDLRYDLSITLAEAAAGVTREIAIPRRQTCETCSGNGCAPGTQPETCPQCQGSGQMRVSQGWFTISRPCSRCGGKGELIRVPCATCHGTGHQEKETRLSIQVPAGADTGVQIRGAGQGDTGLHGGPPGDLYVVIHVQPHPIFERDGDDLLCEVPISFAAAALGGDIEVPTLNGTERLRVDAGTQTGSEIVLRGKGLTNLRGFGRGDQKVRLVVETPTKLNAQQKELLREFAALSGEQTHPAQKSFLDKVRDALGV